MRTSRLTLCLLLTLSAVFPLRAQTSPSPAPRVRIAPMKTSIYVGSVSLTTSDFIAQDDCFTATYDARVRPWFFWGESGDIKVKLAVSDLARLALNQTIEF